MLEIGKYHTLEVVKAVDFGLYLDFDGEEILLPKKYVPEGTNVDGSCFCKFLLILIG